MWKFVVRDNGIGLNMDPAEQIFEVFRRLHREGNTMAQESGSPYAGKSSQDTADVSGWTLL
jgi:light-regulated signal transduction histidine kinase (bacteriophytochrome)